MTIQIHRLLSKRCEETGELGLIVKGIEPNNFYFGDSFVARDSENIAHDLVEHVNGVGQIGTVFDELQAFGALWYTRGHRGSLRSGDWYHTPAQHMSGDIARMAALAFTNDLGGDLPYQRPGRFEADFDEILALAKDEIQHELKHYHDVARFNIPAYLTQVRRGLRLGARLQERRYRNGPDPYCQFWAIDDAVRPVLQRIEYENQIFELTVKGDKARCREIYPED